MERLAPEAAQKVTCLLAVYIGSWTGSRAVCRLRCEKRDRDLEKMRCLIVVVGLLAFAQAKPALIYTQQLQPVGVEYAPTAEPQVQPHPAVALNAASEAQLPRELLKSADFYDNPAVATGLAKESWFTNKEMQVVEREAEKIPREKIYNIVKSAGFLDQH